MDAPRIILADDHQMLLEGLQSLLSRDFNVIAIATNGAKLLQLCRELKPDVVVTDIIMPETSGMEVAAALLCEVPRPRVILLTMQTGAELAMQAFRLGVTGYVMKHAASSELISAIREVLAGRTFVSPRIGRELLGPFLRSPSLTPREQLPAPFTPRQIEVLRLIAQGKTMKEVAAALGISTRTAEAHKYQMMERHGIHTVPELLRLGMQFGAVELPAAALAPGKPLASPSLRQAS